MLNRIVLEIRYDDGIVYLDRCGALTVALDRVLGKPFKNTVSPSMTHGEFTSAMERLSIRYGPDRFLVDQSWLETQVRFEKVAPTAWAEVSKRLDVESKVTRCGLRLFALWQVPGPDAGPEIIAASGLVSETERWSGLMGSPVTKSFSGVAQRGDLRVRASLDSVEMKIEGRFFPEDQKFAFEHGVQLDLDYTSSSNSGAFSKERLQNFLRTSFQDAKRLIEGVAEVLRGSN